MLRRPFRPASGPGHRRRIRPRHSVRDALIADSATTPVARPQATRSFTRGHTLHEADYHPVSLPGRFGRGPRTRGGERLITRGWADAKQPAALTRLCPARDGTAAAVRTPAGRRHVPPSSTCPRSTDVGPTPPPKPHRPLDRNARAAVHGTAGDDLNQNTATAPPPPGSSDTGHRPVDVGSDTARPITTAARGARPGLGSVVLSEHPAPSPVSGTGPRSPSATPVRSRA